MPAHSPETDTEGKISRRAALLTCVTLKRTLTCLKVEEKCSAESVYFINWNNGVWLRVIHIVFVVGFYRIKTPMFCQMLC